MTRYYRTRRAQDDKELATGSSRNSRSSALNAAGLSAFATWPASGTLRAARRGSRRRSLRRALPARRRRARRAPRAPESGRSAARRDSRLSTSRTSRRRNSRPTCTPSDRSFRAVAHRRQAELCRAALAERAHRPRLTHVALDRPSVALRLGIARERSEQHDPFEAFGRASQQLEGDDAAETAADERETLRAERVGDGNDVLRKAFARDRRRIGIGFARAVPAQLDRRRRATRRRTPRAGDPKSPQSNRRRARRSACPSREPVAPAAPTRAPAITRHRACGRRTRTARRAASRSGRRLLSRPARRA